MTDMLDVRVDGAQEVARGLEASELVIKKELQSVTKEVLGLWAERLAEYPAPPAGSSYERTGALGQGWTDANPLRRDVRGRFAGGDAVVATLSNPVPYTRWVQQAATQAWMHAGRWQTIESIGEEMQRELDRRTRQIQQAIVRLILARMR